MDKNKLRQVIIDQQSQFKKTDDLIDRDISLEYYLKGDESVIITGIRRCGKSSLLKLISKKISGIKLYINFEDIRLTDFSKENFEDIKSIVIELFGEEKVTYFLDEIQNIADWERWVNNLFSEKIKVFLTGSNSNLLSSEIATHLTGRNKVIKLFPFSFKEYLRFKGISYKHDLTSTEQSIIFQNFNKYLETGGFPLIVKNDDLELSKQYFEDIVNKDILNRHQIKQVKELKDLILYLASNTGKTYAYSTLKEVTGIKSLSTIKNYIEFLKSAYLIYTIQRFDFSVKKQQVSSQKVYLSDNSFLKTVSFNFSGNIGKMLENLVFLELNKTKEIYYHLENKECDFIVKEGLNIAEAIQVCYDLSSIDTKKREIEGLILAMDKYKLKEGLILTMENEESIEIKDKKITIKPVWRWMLE